ncbi:hypothetical protein [Clostridium sp. Marseille-P2415]|uniref:hypothetical protein n=1 Tax=Clostridium sp. Marseille-P2415 TaxID=1805471 RepID=UPI0009886073|nr:hypothetical protein [Clostridium sp. Marseille-P2415]
MSEIKKRPENPDTDMEERKRGKSWKKDVFLGIALIVIGLPMLAVKFGILFMVLGIFFAVSGICEKISRNKEV